MAEQRVKEIEPAETQIVEIIPPDIEKLIYVIRNKHNRRSRIFAVPIWHRKRTGDRKERRTRRQTYITVCIHRTGNRYAGQCVA